MTEEYIMSNYQVESIVKFYGGVDACKSILISSKCKNIPKERYEELDKCYNFSMIEQCLLSMGIVVEELK